MKKKSAFHSVRPNLREGGFFKLRVLFGVLLCFAGVTIVLLELGKASAQPRTPAVQINPRWDGFNAASKIAPWVMEHTANGQEAEFFVVLADQADLSAAADSPDEDGKGPVRISNSPEQGPNNARPILQWLRDRAIEHRSFYIVNAILVKGDSRVSRGLGGSAGGGASGRQPALFIMNFLNTDRSRMRGFADLRAPATIEPGINYTHAPEVWALGFTGQNIVVASADTGVRWTHNALKPHYRGWDGVTANHNFNWHDSIHDSSGNPCGNDSPQPCDDFFHGTTPRAQRSAMMAARNQIGMAPGRKMDRLPQHG